MPQFTQEDINNRFRFHPANAGKALIHEDVRGAVRQAAFRLDELVPDGQEKALAMKSLEEAMFWANAGVARNP